MLKSRHRVAPMFAFPIAAILMMISGAISAAEFGTQAEAKVMLDRAVLALKADKGRALDLFTSGNGGFVKGDLYVFCGGSDGLLTAHPYNMGVNLKEFKDKSGKAAGEEMYAVAEEGKYAEVSYTWVRPGGGEEQVDKSSFITKVGDQICGVGYYK